MENSDEEDGPQMSKQEGMMKFMKSSSILK